MEINNHVKRCMEKSEGKLDRRTVYEIEENLKENNSKKAYQLVKDLTTVKQGKPTTVHFDLEKLKDPNVLETFQAMIGGKFAPLTIMNHEDTDLNSMITTFNTAVTETASETLGKHRQKKKKPGSQQNFFFFFICATKGEN